MLQRWRRRSCPGHLIPVSLGGSNDPDNLWPLLANKEIGTGQMKAVALMLHQMV